MCQKIKLNIITKDAPYQIKRGVTYEFRLYFMTGFKDSVSIYLNKKLIKQVYAESTMDVPSPFYISINFKNPK